MISWCGYTTYGIVFCKYSWHCHSALCFITSCFRWCFDDSQSVLSSFRQLNKLHVLRLLQTNVDALSRPSEVSGIFIIITCALLKLFSLATFLLSLIFFPVLSNADRKRFYDKVDVVKTKSKSVCYLQIIVYL